MGDDAPPDALGVVGTGLIGGSIVLRALSEGREVLAFDRDPDIRAAVAGAGARAVKDLEALAVEADMVVVALPPEAAAGAWRRLATASVGRTRSARLLVVDVASTKAPLVSELGPLDAGGWTTDHATFVLTHPMAGREHSGWRAAIPDLYDRAAWLVCPHAHLVGADLARILAFVATLGARPVLFDARHHDRFAALVSHLPHLIAFCYRDLLEAVDPAGTWYRFSGGSLADMLRVADADPALWTEILAANADELAVVRRQLVERMERGWPAHDTTAGTMPVTPLFVPGPPAGTDRPTSPIPGPAVDDVQVVTFEASAPLADRADELAATGSDGFEVVATEHEPLGMVTLHLGRAH